MQLLQRLRVFTAKTSKWRSRMRQRVSSWFVETCHSHSTGPLVSNMLSDPATWHMASAIYCAFFVFKNLGRCGIKVTRISYQCSEQECVIPTITSFSLSHSVRVMQLQEFRMLCKTHEQISLDARNRKWHFNMLIQTAAPCTVPRATRMQHCSQRNVCAQPPTRF